MRAHIRPATIMANGVTLRLPIPLARELAIAKPGTARMEELTASFNALGWQDQLACKTELAHCRAAMRGQRLAEVG